MTRFADPALAAALAKAEGWCDEVLALDDERAVATLLVACSRLMLPYWESHYRRDDKMECLIAAMNLWAVKPGLKSRLRVRDALRRAAVESRGYLSPVWPEPPGYDFPADYASDSIIAAANAIVARGGPNFRNRAERCLDAAAEAVSQVMGHRQPDDESTDFCALGLERLRTGLIEQLRAMAAGAT